MNSIRTNKVSGVHGGIEGFHDAVTVHHNAVQLHILNELHRDRDEQQSDDELVGAGLVGVFMIQKQSQQSNRCEGCKRTLSPGAYAHYVKNGKQCTHGASDAKKKTQKIRVFQPGDVLAALIRQLGYTKTKTCGCEAMQKKINSYGWLGAFAHRTEILEYLKDQAVKANIPFDEATVWSAFTAMIFSIGHPKELDQ